MDPSNPYFSASTFKQMVRDFEWLREFKTKLDIGEPWRIEDFSVRQQFGCHHVWIYDVEAAWPCPECRRDYPRAGQTALREFVCETCRPETHLFVRIPYVLCPTHGRREIAVAWTRDLVKWREVPPEQMEPDRRKSRWP